MDILLGEEFREKFRTRRAVEQRPEASAEMRRDDQPVRIARARQHTSPIEETQLFRAVDEPYDALAVSAGVLPAVPARAAASFT